MTVAVAQPENDVLGPRVFYYRRVAVALSLGLIIIVGFYVRYLFWIQYGGLEHDYIIWADKNYFGGIARAYVRMTSAIVRDLFGSSYFPGTESFPPFVFSSSEVGYPPGYPMFLSTLWLLGARSLQAMRLTQGFCDALAVIPLFYVLRRLRVARTIALLGCLFYAVAPWSARGSTAPLAEAILPAAVICVLALMAACEGRRSRAAWFSLGVGASVLSLVRPDMILLCGPMALWALTTAARERRWIAFRACLIGFAVLPVGWGLFNLVERGQFLMTTQAGSYALWSGLGQIPNPYGYVVSDQLAGEKMNQLGIGWHSKEMGAYYWREYLDAWKQHPLYVLQTALKRAQIIASTSDYLQDPPSVLTEAIEFGGIPFVLAIILLVFRRRYAETLLVAGPLGYALASLGLVYVEARYVRYASLSYLLADAILLQAVADTVGRIGYVRRGTSPAVAVAGAAVLLIAAGPSVGELIRIDQNLGIHRLAEDSQLPPSPAISVFDWQASVQGVELQKTSDGGLSVNTSFGSTQYQLTARVPLEPKVSVVVMRVRAEVKSGGAALGILKADGSRWLAVFPIGDAVHRVQYFVVPITDIGVTDASVLLVLINNRPPSDEGRSTVLINALDLIPLCDPTADNTLDKMRAMLSPRLQIAACGG